MRPTEPRSRAILPILAVAGLLAASGIGWSLLNLGRVPHYGDTVEYLRLSRGRGVDAFRGPLYPALLRIVDGLDGSPRFPRHLAWETPRAMARLPCAAPRILTTLQIFQILVGIGAVAWFVRSFAALDLLAPRLGRRATAASGAALVGALAFDPLVAHFQLSILTDGLCLSASLVACAALARVALADAPRLRTALLLFFAVLVAASLRPEKGWVWLGTALASVVVWRFSGAGTRWGHALAIGATAAAVVGTLLWHRAVHEERGRWDLYTTVLNQRVIHPHLASIRGDLSPETQRLLSPEAAALYDARIHNTWRVVNEITRSDPERRSALTEELAVAALRRHAGRIAADSVSDLAEHAIATPSWYGRLVAWALEGAPVAAYRRHSEMTPRTWAALADHRPGPSLVLGVFAGAIFLAATLLAIVACLRRSRWLREVLQPRWVPVFAFALGNAAVFSFTADLVHIRYALFAHVACLLLAYRGALEWAAARTSPLSRPAGTSGSPRP
ncbi:MAG: hypothetical protein FJ144_00760 [Deltaproteobacteria bacterium]|nr:hypothetical protein [Deltaproteobacteria bacterium]